MLIINKMPGLRINLTHHQIRRASERDLKKTEEEKKEEARVLADNRKGLCIRSTSSGSMDYY